MDETHITHYLSPSVSTTTLNKDTHASHNGNKYTKNSKIQNQIKYTFLFGLLLVINNNNLFFVI
jgi:hypothetical protein